MANSTKTTKTENVGTTIDALVKEGKALAKIWKQTNSLKDTTKANGFDTRLGKLLQELKAQSSLDSGQVSRQVLTAHGINTIDRRRRAEALWFVENEVECREFIAKSKKGFTSLTALQAAMRKAAKAASEDATEGKPSNVGQSDEATEGETKGATEQRSVNMKINRTKMVNDILLICKQSDFNVEDIIDDLMAHVARQSRKDSEAVKQQKAG